MTFQIVEDNVLPTAMPCEIVADTREITREQWLQLRKSGIGGSDAGAIMGLSKYGSPLTVYLSKTTDIQDEGNNYTRWGNLMEGVIRQEFPKDYEEKEGKLLTVMEAPMMLRSQEYPFMLANIDGLVIADSGDTGGLEIKTATVMQSKDWKDDEVPDSYYCQVQHYMAVTGLPYFLVVCLLGKDLIWRHVPRNEEFISMLIEEERNFWEAFVLPKQMPAPSGLDSETDLIDGLFRDQKEEEIPLDTIYEYKIEEYLALRDQISELDAEKKRIQQELKLALGEAKKGLVGEHSVSWSRYTTERFNSSKYKKDHPKQYARYCTKSESGRLTVK